MTRTEEYQARKAMVAALATLIREEGIDGPDVHDIACQIELGAAPDDWTGAGRWTHMFCLSCTDVLIESAFTVLRSAMDELGWP